MYIIIIHTIDQPWELLYEIKNMYGSEI